MAIELGIWENGPDTKTDFHLCPHRKQGFTARNQYVGGTGGKVSTEKGDTDPGLLPSQRVRSGFTSMTQVMKDIVIGNLDISFFCVHTDQCIS